MMKRKGALKYLRVSRAVLPPPWTEAGAVLDAGGVVVVADLDGVLELAGHGARHVGHAQLAKSGHAEQPVGVHHHAVVLADRASRA